MYSFGAKAYSGGVSFVGKYFLRDLSELDADIASMLQEPSDIDIDNIIEVSKNDHYDHAFLNYFLLTEWRHLKPRSSTGSLLLVEAWLVH